MPGVAKREAVLDEKLERHSYFYQLVRPANPKKKRRCLKCGVVFLSASYGNRCCGSCAAQNARSSKRASEAY